MSSSRHTHWCYTCRAPVRLRGEHIMCSNCSGGFVQELDELENISASELFALASNDDQDQRHEIIEALSGLVRRRLVRRNRELGIRGLSELIPEDGTELETGLSPWLIFHGQIPVRMYENGGVEVLFDGDSSEEGGQANVGELSVGRELDELIEQLTANDKEGPAPASKSMINAIPTLKICQAHVQADSHCPICIERFELGSEVRQMPCSHIYHSDCIMTWLVRRNSCPICRRQLPEQESSSAHRNQSSTGGSRGIHISSSTTGSHSGNRSNRASIDTRTTESRSHHASVDTRPAEGRSSFESITSTRTPQGRSSFESIIGSGNLSSHTSNSIDTGRVQNSWDSQEQRRHNGSWEGQEQRRRDGFSGTWQNAPRYEENHEIHEMSYSGWPFDY